MLEYQGTIDRAWLEANPDTAPALIRALPSFLGEDEPGRFLLRAAGSDHDWDADVWLWLTDEGLLVAVASPTLAFHEDVRSLVEALRPLTGFELLDDDGDPAEFD